MGQLYQAYDSSRKALDKTLFEGKDGSPLSRLNLIYNASKHQLAGTDQPTWITNDGIESSNAKLSFLEMEELLCWCGRIATTLTSTNGKGEQGKPGG